MVLRTGLADAVGLVEQMVFTTEEFLRARCALSKDIDTFTYWSGTGYSSVPQEKQQVLFGVVGVNIARCYKIPQLGGWVLTSRELEYYTDVQTGEPLYQWTNPWTNETVTVVHVANNPVQFPLGNFSVPGTDWNGVVDFPQTVPNFYPNPLANDPRFADYSPQAMYQSTESFNFWVPLSELVNSSSVDAEGLRFGWVRTSLWLPCEFLPMA